MSPSVVVGSSDKTNENQSIINLQNKTTSDKPTASTMVQLKISRMFRNAILSMTAVSFSSVTAFTILSKNTNNDFSSPQWSQLLASTSSRVQCQGVIWEGLPEHNLDHYKRMEQPSRYNQTSHVIFGHLLKPEYIEKYEVFKKINEFDTENQELVLANIQLGSQLDGHKGVVHGGILSLLFDDAMGCAFTAMGIEVAFTANLNVDYRAPVPANSNVVIRVRLSKQEGRKLFFSAQMTNPDFSLLYAEGTTLYIIPR